MLLKKQLISSIKLGDNDKVSDVLVQMSIEEINKRNEFGETALHMACRYKNNPALSQLLAKPGINVNVKNRFRFTPLHVACRSNNQWAVDQLLDCSAIKENAKDINGCTPIMRAATMCSKEALAVMLESPFVDLDVKDNGGRGLDEYLGLWSGSEEKKKCFDMIQEERLKRRNVIENGKQKLRIGNEKLKKISRINEKVQDCEQRLKEIVDSRKLKRRQLDEKQSLEIERLTKKHRNEKSVLEEKFDREYENIESSMTILKETRKDLVQDIENRNMESSKNDRSKVEAVEDSLECPVCMEIMKPPTRIWMCHNGHAICESCKGNLICLKEGPHPPCPTCKSEKINQRAFIAEKFAAAVFNT